MPINNKNKAIRKQFLY